MSNSRSMSLFDTLAKLTIFERAVLRDALRRHLAYLRDQGLRGHEEGVCQLFLDQLK